MAEQVIRIERLDSRPGGTEEPISTPRGYQLADPGKGSSKHYAENAVYAPTFEEAAELVGRGFSIWMGRKGRRGSLISPGSLRIVRATPNRTRSQVEIKASLERYVKNVRDLLRQRGITPKVAAPFKPEKTETGGWCFVLDNSAGVLGREFWLDRYLGGSEPALYYGIFGKKPDVAEGSALFCPAGEKIEISNKDLVVDAEISHLGSQKAEEASGHYITGPYDRGFWFGRYATSITVAGFF